MKNNAKSFIQLMFFFLITIPYLYGLKYYTSNQFKNFIFIRNLKLIKRIILYIL